jgi:uncharacterized protein (TIGR02996 family)
MSDSQTPLNLLRAILSEPACDEAQLIWADWLEDNDDPLAELVRVQRQMQARNGDENSNLQKRFRALLGTLPFPERTRYRGDYSRRDRPLFHDWTYRFDEGIPTILLHQMPESRDDLPPAEWYARFPRYAIEIDQVNSYSPNVSVDPRGLTRLMEFPEFAGCVRLALENRSLTVAALRKLFSLPQASSLLALSITNKKLASSVLEALVASDYLKNLVSLSFRSTSVGDAGVEILAKGSFPELTHLNLCDNKIKGGIASLATSPGFQNLRHLDLASNKLTLGAFEALAEPNAFPNLQRLELQHCGIKNEAAQALATGGGLGQLQQLLLADNMLRDDGAVALLQSPHLKSLRELDFDWTRVGVKTVEVLLRTDRFVKHGDFSFWSCQLADKAFEVLASSPNAVHVKHLLIPFSKLADKGMTALAKSPYLKNVEVLRASYCKIGAAGIRAMLENDAFPKLRVCDIDSNALGDEGTLDLVRFMRLRGVEEIQIGSCGLTGAGLLRMIQEQLLEDVTSLWLDYNTLGEEALIALADSTQVRQLRTLAICATGMTEKAVIVDPDKVPWKDDECFFGSPQVVV